MALPLGPANPDGAAWCAGDHRSLVSHAALYRRLDVFDELTTARLRHAPHAGLWAALDDPRIAARQERFRRLPQAARSSQRWLAAAAVLLALGAAWWWAARLSGPPPAQIRGQSLVSLYLAGDGRARPLDGTHRPGETVVFRYSSQRPFLAVVAITAGDAVPVLPVAGLSVAVRSGPDQRGPVAFELDDDPRATTLVFVFSEAPLDVAALARALGAPGAPLEARARALRGPTVDVVIDEIPARQRE